MDAYIYSADIYCEDCAQKIIDDLDADGFNDTGDSEDWPQGPYDDGGGEADSPQHCGSGDHCVNAEEVKWRGRIVRVPGTAAASGKVGAFLENPLTREGVQYLCEMVSRPKQSDWEKGVHKIWLDYYRKHGYAKEIVACVREEVRSHRGRYSR